MASPDSRWKVSKLLYASLWRVVIWAVAVSALLWGGRGWTQVARKLKPSAGPRALGLLELAANGKGHLVPVVILYEGQFYDASSYKASPVPMALDSGTVYEAEKTGAPQGLFTISGALHSNDNRWVGAGTWEAAGSKPAKKAPAPKKKPDEDPDAPPVLHRGDAKKPEKPPEPPPAAKVPESTAPAPSKPAPTPVAETSAPEDPDRPVLRRGQQTPPSAEEPKMTKVRPGVKSPALASEIGPVTVIPAVSDATGPEPHTYVYPTKPEDVQIFRKKILSMAAVELQNYQKPNAAPSDSKKPGIKKGGTLSGKVPLPDFQDVDLKILDLSSSNEPVLVLTAKVLPSRASATPDLQYFLTLVAREDIYGDLHKAFAKITDTRHLDALPRYELIDAVDADGDGRGELLFRQFSDAGKSFILYRVIGDQLWPLYESAPQ